MSLESQTKLQYWLARQNFYIGWPNKTSIQVIICISDNKLYTNLHIMFPLQKKTCLFDLDPIYDLDL